jgi:hypothetical protein
VNKDATGLVFDCVPWWNNATTNHSNLEHQQHSHKKAHKAQNLKEILCVPYVLLCGFILAQANRTTDESLMKPRHLHVARRST